MNSNKQPIFGVIYVGDKKLCFYMDNFEVTLMQTDPSDQSEIVLDGTFMRGVTYVGQELMQIFSKNIAIYKGDRAISFSCAYRMRVPAYILTQNSCVCDTFDYIECMGGTLKDVFFCSGLDLRPCDDNKFDQDSKLEYLVYSRDDSEEYKFSINDYACLLKVGSTNRVTHGIKANKIVNDNVRLILEFDRPQNIDQCLFCVGKLKNLLSFMTFRKHVGFDNICLKQRRDISKQAQLFLKEDSPYTKKSLFNNITFHDLGNSVEELASIIFDEDNCNHAIYSNGFMPESDGAKQIDTTNIRLICSALEHEFKKHQKNYKPQKNFKYAADKFFCLYEANSDEMKVIFQHYFSSHEQLSKKDISDFVKYRNKITHGDFKDVITGRLAITAFMLQGLIYCCILKRIGVDKNTIIGLCQYKILS